MNVVRLVSVSTLVIVLALVAAFATLALAGGDDSPAYRVHINFTKAAEEADLGEVRELVRGYDSGADLAIMESFPLQGAAVVETDDAGFCDEIVGELEAKPYVRDASCDVHTPVDGDGDEPVSDGE